MKESELKKNQDGQIGKIYEIEGEEFFIPKSETLSIPKEIFGTSLSKQQKQDLLAGKIIHIMKDKKSFFISVDKELNTVVLRNSKDFQIPKEVGGYTLSSIDKFLLSNKQFTPPILFFDKKTDKYFYAELGITEDNKGLKFKGIVTIPKAEALKIQEQAKVQEKDTILHPSPKVVQETIQETIQEQVQEKDTSSKVKVQETNEQNLFSQKIIKFLEAKNFIELNKLVTSNPHLQIDDLVKDHINNMELPKNQKLGINRLLNISAEETKGAKLDLDEKIDGKSNIKEVSLNTTNQLFGQMG